MVKGRGQGIKIQATEKTTTASTKQNAVSSSPALSSFNKTKSEKTTNKRNLVTYNMWYGDWL